MIARLWHGKTKVSDAAAYLEYLFKSGIPAYRATSGNRGAWVLRRTDNEEAHFITLSFWESREAIAAFAGADIAVAKYYAEDEKYLLEFESTVAAHRVDEAKKIRDKAEAVRTYAKLAGDLDMQNMAAEIRIRAERRAGQLLLEMEKNPGTQGEGRPRKDGTKRRSSDSTANPPKLEEIGITKDQSSKWQRLALLVSEAAFERAVVQAREKNGELTNAALLREIREIATPSEVLTEPDVNVVASEVIRDIESASRKDKLERGAHLRNRLNPTVRKKLILALKNSQTYAAQCEAQLAKDFEAYTAGSKTFQRVIRERMAEQPDSLLNEKVALAADFRNAAVKEIALADARNLIVANEWLGSLGSTEHAWGLFFGEHLAGCVCFGSTAGTNVKSSVCGSEHGNKVITSREAAAFTGRIRIAARS